MTDSSAANEIAELQMELGEAYQEFNETLKRIIAIAHADTALAVRIAEEKSAELAKYELSAVDQRSEKVLALQRMRKIHAAAIDWWNARTFDPKSSDLAGTAANLLEVIRNEWWKPLQRSKLAELLDG